MNDTVKIALLIDVDDTQVEKHDNIVQTIYSRGRIVLNRVYIDSYPVFECHINYLPFCKDYFLVLGYYEVLYTK